MHHSRLLIQAELDVTPFVGGNLVDLIYHVNDVRRGKQQKPGEGNHTWRAGPVTLIRRYNRAMNDSMAQPREGFGALELPGWKTAVSWVSAALIALLFLVSGLWKITDVQGAAMRMAQAKVPEALSQAAALLFGIAETVGGVLILVPRFRRWGSIVTSILLVAFMIYVGINYNALHG